MLDRVGTDQGGERGAGGLHPAVRPIRALIEAEHDTFVARDDDLLRAGYFCAYTPPELLAAAGLRHARLFKAGDADTVSRGERFTQSVFCDFSKGCIGSFDQNDGDPLYRAVDKVYNFHTCASMKRASEVIEQFVPIKLLNLPRLRGEEASRAYFREEIVHFRDDLADLVGHPITADDVSAQIVLYNTARRLLKQLSELRRRPSPPLSGRDYLELVRGYYYLPAETLIEVYGRLYDTLSRERDDGARPLRLMIAGSIMADGDRKIVDLVEEEIGARIVVEDHCAGVRPFVHTVPETGDPFQALADGYLDQAPCARMKPLDDSLELPSLLARDYAVDGILYVYLKFCACYGITRSVFVDHFRRLDIPVLELSSDYSQSDHGQLKTRIEAFVEILNEQRDAGALALATAATPIA